jgi:hypothetical protein
VSKESEELKAKSEKWKKDGLQESRVAASLKAKQLVFAVALAIVAGGLAGLLGFGAAFMYEDSRIGGVSAVMLGMLAGTGSGIIVALAWCAAMGARQKLENPYKLSGVAAFLAYAALVAFSIIVGDIIGAIIFLGIAVVFGRIARKSALRMAYADKGAFWGLVAALVSCLILHLCLWKATYTYRGLAGVGIPLAIGSVFAVIIGLCFGYIAGALWGKWCVMEPDDKP